MIRKEHAQRSRRLGQSTLPQEEVQRRAERGPRDVTVDCGWGRLIAGYTFSDSAQIAHELLAEEPGQRDIAFYVDKPHVVVSHAPEKLFVDPSETYRLSLNNYVPSRAAKRGFTVRRLRSRSDVAAINAIYRARRMVPVDASWVWSQRAERKIVYVLAEDQITGEVLGVVMGLDHSQGIDPRNEGSSLWALAVSPYAGHAGIGEALTRFLAEHFQARGRAYMDLSVLHDNQSAIALYEKLGFQRISSFAVKRRNAINVPLFTRGVKPDEEGLNPYARIIVDEAQRRGIHVEVIDAENGYFKLSHGGRSVVCRESLSELTSAVAMSRCADKRVTVKLLASAGLGVPEQMLAADDEQNAAFLRKHGDIVVKPVDGEQGKGISVNITSVDDMSAAIEQAAQFSERVLLEQFCAGLDLRIVVINHQVVAAAVRRPATIVGDGKSTIEELIAARSKRRAAATGGESRIPMDAETRRCVALHGYEMSDVLALEQSLEVRKTANLHTGGTIHDVTDDLHPALRSAAEHASRVLDIPVTGLDFLVPSVSAPEYVIIEANERPGLANHEPRPTAQCFIDLLFPQMKMKAESP
ncbi:N-acetylglutaminylglutamine synthetase [Hydrogenophaga sp. 5NK40-0174]|uniref:N-acetylglutaminylglutamine synthetase n=1 Tax=Hydrogenophaga sp. 5NK40-0174 TaxID=3127649 RepID=UPI003103E8B0